MIIDNTEEGFNYLGVFRWVLTPFEFNEIRFERQTAVFVIDQCTNPELYKIKLLNGCLLSIPKKILEEHTMELITE